MSVDVITGLTREENGRTLHIIGGAPATGGDPFVQALQVRLVAGSGIEVHVRRDVAKRVG